MFLPLSVVQKDFMEKTDKFLYYEDGDAKLVVLPMTGGLQAVFTLGEIDNLKDALSKAERTRVNVKLPKMDLDTSFTNKELVDFLKARGVDLAFKDDGSADFSVMCDLSGMGVGHIPDFRPEICLFS